MNRLLALVREHLSALGDETDRRLLEGFVAARDEAAFAELVRRYGPLVWGVSRRGLNNQQDAEDAFQATFLVLVRRAASIAPDTPLGPWLHRVAAMTARNVLRQNRRRAAVGGPMEHEIASRGTDPDLPLDLDAALLALPERDRVPIVLCHLQGLTRREAAARLECPEGTLSARLHRALGRLRARLDGRGAAALAVGGSVAVPAGLQAAAVRSATIFATSSSTAAGISPAVAGLTDGVLRMFWMKKLLAGTAAAVLLCGGLLAGLAARTDGTARANEPLAAEPQSPPEDADAAVKRIEKRIEELRKQKELLGAMEMELFAEKEKVERARKEKAVAAAVAELGKDLAISVGEVNPSGYSFTVREVVNGKVAEVHTSDIDILRTYLTRAFDDPRGPKQLRISAHKYLRTEKLCEVFAACAAAGFAKASFSHTERTRYRDYSTFQQMLQDEAVRSRVVNGTAVDFSVLRYPESTLKPGVIDLTKYAPKKR